MSYQPVLLKETIEDMLVAGTLIDARCGGYVLGRARKDGGVKLIQQLPGGITIIGEVEGGEYILNQNAYLKFRGNVDSLNLDLAVSGPNPQMSIGTLLLNANTEREKMLWVEGRFFVVNRLSAWKYFELLENINWIGYNEWLNEQVGNNKHDNQPDKDFEGGGQASD